MVLNRAVSFSKLLVSGECSAFALFLTVVKLIMLHYLCFARKNIQFLAVLPFIECVYQYLKKRLFNICRRQIKMGHPVYCVESINFKDISLL